VQKRQASEDLINKLFKDLDESGNTMYKYCFFYIFIIQVRN